MIDMKSVDAGGVLWGPQPGPQADAILADWCEEMFFGGAKFGGKTDFLLGDFLLGAVEYRGEWNGILIRQSLPEMEDILRRSHELYTRAGGQYLVAKRTWIFPNLGGAKLAFRHLARPEDFTAYNGHSYTWIGFDELGQWPTPEGYHLMKGCLRWAGAVVKKKRIRATGNPGQVGQGWVKRYFIDHAPGGFVPYDDPVTGMTRMFIPSRVSDNKLGLLKDPGYLGRLKGMGSPQLVKAMLEGDWNAIIGSFFPELNKRHILVPFRVPDYLLRFMSYDWGSASPFSCGWWFVSDGTVVAKNGFGEEIVIPAGAIVRYREWYGMDRVTGEGLRMTNRDQAIKMVETERKAEEVMAYRVGDRSMFGDQGGISKAEEFAANGVIFNKSDSKRENGWAQVRARLIGVDNRPLIYFFETCVDGIRGLSSVPHDRLNPEDVDTDSEDHAADDIRYACMSRPWVTKGKVYVDTSMKAPPLLLQRRLAVRNISGKQKRI